MSRWYGDEKECPSNPYEARREGERARSYDRNPYEHGRHSMDYDCERAYKEFEHGREQARFERMEEERREEEAHARAAQQRDFERQQYEAAAEEDRLQQLEYEQHMASEQEIAEAEAQAVLQETTQAKTA